MSQCKLYLLGAPRVERAGKPIEIERRKAAALLAYLAVTQQPHTRDALAAMFWQDSDQSRAFAYLRTTLWTLNKALGEGVLLADGDTVSIQPELWVDVWTFRQCSRQQTVEALTQAADLYANDFLAGFTLPDGDAFEEWQFFERESLRRELGDVLDNLIKVLITQGDFEAAIPYARRWLALDLLHEAAHRMLMRLYAWTDQWSAALRQYQTCTDTLDQNLGINPDSETRALYESIVERRITPPVTLRAQRAAPLPENPSTSISSQTATSTLKALQTVQLHLPTQTTPFVSREAERAELAELLADPACRLLTLLGPGGIGKTRLAIQVARDVAETFEHGVYFISLATVTGTESIIPTVADALQIFGLQREQKATTTKLYDFLREKHLLLVLDNIEHLLEGADIIGELLSHAPHVIILTTSRERLNLHEEWVYDTPGLSYPQNGKPVDFVTYGAIQLFLQTARRVRPDFLLTEADQPHVARICRLVEGHPLAVELAAAWTQMLTCEEIAQEITRSLDFLSASLRNLPPRHRSIRAVFETSWEALPAQEKRVLSQFSIFRGGFTREAAQAVTGASLPLLRSLVNKSLVSVDVFGRYDLHELLRQFAQEKLDDAPDERMTAFDRHMDYFTTFLSEMEPRLKDRRQVETLQQIDLELDNLWVAWRWAVQRRAVANLQMLINGLSLFLGMRSRIIETREMGHYALKYLDDTPDLQLILAQIKILLATAYDWEGDEMTDQLRAEAEPIIRDRDDPVLGLSFVLLARQYSWIQRDMNLGVFYANKARAIFEASGEQMGAAFAVRTLGDVYHHHVRYTESDRYYRESLELSRKIGDRWGEADVLRRLAEVAYTLGHYPEAERLSREALAYSDEFGSLPEIGFNLAQIAQFVGLQGRYDEAREISRQSREIISRLGYRNSQGWEFYGMGNYDYYEQKYDTALDWFSKSIALFQETDNQHGQGWALLNVSHIRFIQGDYAEAEHLARTVLDMLRAEDDPWGIAEGLYRLALARTAQGDTDMGRDLLADAIRRDVDNTSIMMLCRHLWGYGYWLAQTSQPEPAVEVLAQVANHHATWAPSKADAIALLDDLHGELPDSVFRRAYERGVSRDIDSFVRDVAG